MRVTCKLVGCFVAFGILGPLGRATGYGQRAWASGYPDKVVARDAALRYLAGIGRAPTTDIARAVLESPNGFVPGLRCWQFT